MLGLCRAPTRDHPTGIHLLPWISSRTNTPKNNAILGKAKKTVPFLSGKSRLGDLSSGLFASNAFCQTTRLGGHEDAYERNGRGVVELDRRKESVVAMELEFGKAKSELLLSNGLRKAVHTAATIRKNRYFLRLDWI